MTNTYQWLESVKSEGVVYNAMGDGKTAPVAPQDIAVVAVRALTEANSPEIVEVTGAELLTLREQVDIVSRVTSRPIRVVEIDRRQAEQRLKNAGFPPFVAKAVTGSYEDIRSGRVAFVRDTVHNAKGAPPVAYAEWVQSQQTRLA